MSAHGFEELSEDDISFSDLLMTLASARVIEEYPDYHKGPCILALQTTGQGEVVHAVWGLAKNTPDVATLVTAYRPDPEKWDANFEVRRPR